MMRETVSLVVKDLAVLINLSYGNNVAARTYPLATYFYFTSRVDMAADNSATSSIYFYPHHFSLMESSNHFGNFDRFLRMNLGKRSSIKTVTPKSVSLRLIRPVCWPKEIIA